MFVKRRQKTTRTLTIFVDHGISKQQPPFCAKILVCTDICPRTLSVPRSEQFSERNCELQGTDNVQGQISVHIFAPNGGYCVYYPSNIFRNTSSFENWAYILGYSPVQLGNIRSRDVFRPITPERKYLMDYKPWYTTRKRCISSIDSTALLTYL